MSAPAEALHTGTVNDVSWPLSDVHLNNLSNLMLNATFLRCEAVYMGLCNFHCVDRKVLIPLTSCDTKFHSHNSFIPMMRRNIKSLNDERFFSVNSLFAIARIFSSLHFRGAFAQQDFHRFAR